MTSSTRAQHWQTPRTPLDHPGRGYCGRCVWGTATREHREGCLGAVARAAVRGGAGCGARRRGLRCAAAWPVSRWAWCPACKEVSDE